LFDKNVNLAVMPASLKAPEKRPGRQLLTRGCNDLSESRPNPTEMQMWMLYSAYRALVYSVYSATVTRDEYCAHERLEAAWECHRCQNAAADIYFSQDLVTLV
jgi:hypothetical protein